MKLFKAMATVAGLTGVSRIAGFIRDVLTARILGAGPVADAFFVALKLPNFFRRVTAEGAFSVSFVPVYSETLEAEGQARADLFASNIFMYMLSFLAVFTLIAIWLMPFVLYGIAPGFTDDPVRFDLAVELSRITFPYLLLMSLTALLGGVLNSLDKFAPFAFAPVFFNLCLIAALYYKDLFETTGHAMAYGVFVAGILQFLWLLGAALKNKVRIRLVRPQFSIKVKQVFKLMGPGVIGAGVVHINLFADLIMASFLQVGAISYLYYADRLNQLPLGVVGIAVGTALLPMLSRAMVKERDGGGAEDARHLYNRALEVCFLLALPAAVALAVIPYSIVSTLFESGAFTADDTQMTAMVLMCYAIGLPAYIAIKVFSTAHWARQDTITPVKISIKATVLNIILSLVFIQFIGPAGIALGTGLTGWLQFYEHIRALKTHPAARLDDRFKRAIVRIVLSACIMGGILYIVQYFLGSFVEMDTFDKIIRLVVLVFLGMTSYAAAVLITGAVDLKTLKNMMRKRKKV